MKHLCIATNKHPFDAANYPESIRSAIQPESVYVDTRVRLHRALPYAVKKASYNVDRFKSKGMEEKIAQLLEQESYDIVVLESLFVCPYVSIIRKTFKGKIFVRTHNVEADIWHDLAKETPSALKSKILSKLAKDLQRYEINILQQVDGLMTITENDLHRFRELGIETPAETIKVAIDLDQPLDYVPNKLFHLGAMDWSPNQRAVRILLKIFPSIKELNPHAELHIAGRHALRSLKNVSIEGVYIQDFVKDAGHFMRSHGILVAPIDSGSGVRIKILEAMSLGLAVITTPKGALGLESLDGKCLLICKNPNELSQACVSLIESDKRRQLLGKEARAYIENHHSETNIRIKLREFFDRT